MNEEKIMQNKRPMLERNEESTMLARSIVLLVISSIVLIGYLGAVFSAVNFSQTLYYSKNYLPSGKLKVAKIISFIGMILGCISFGLFFLLIYR